MWKRVQKWPLGAGIFHDNALCLECQAAAAPCWSRRRVVGAAVVIPAVRNCLSQLKKDGTRVQTRRTPTIGQICSFTV